MCYLRWLNLSVFFCGYMIIYIYLTPLHKQKSTQGQFLSKVKHVRIQSFPSPELIALPRLKNPVCSTICPLLEGEQLDLYVSQGY